MKADAQARGDRLIAQSGHRSFLSAYADDDKRHIPALSSAMSADQSSLAGGGERSRRRSVPFVARDRDQARVGAAALREGRAADVQRQDIGIAGNVQNTLVGLEGRVPSPRR